MRECTVDLRAGRFAVLSTWLVGLFLICGCNNEANEKNDTERTSEKTPVAEEDFAKLRRALESASQEKSRSRFVALFSKRAMFKLVFEDIKLTNASRRKMESRINRGGNIALLADRIFHGLARKGEFVFVRRIERDNESSMLFRLIVPRQNEVAYFRFDVGRGSKSTTRFKNVYFYLEQESLVTQIRQRVLVELRDAGELESESGRDLTTEIVSDHSNADEYKKMLEWVSSEKWQEAWIAYDKLPELVRQSRRAVIQKLMIAERLGGIYFDTALKDARELIPNSIRIEFIGLNYFLANRSYQEVVHSVDRLVEIVQDPYLNRMKVNPLIRLGELNGAKAIVEELQAQAAGEPSQLLLFEFEISNAEKDFDTCVQLLAQLKSDHGITIDNLAELPRYAELIKSREYKEWKAGSS